MQGIYVISKIGYAAQWRALRDRGYPIISSWIDDGELTDEQLAERWPVYLEEAASAQFVLIHTEPGETLKGGLAEVGAALAGGATVFVCGVVPAGMRTLQHHPRVSVVPSIAQALARIGVMTPDALQGVIADWVGRVYGPEMLFNMVERGRRVFEEASELAQRAGVPEEQAHAIVRRVYSKEPGLLHVEAAQTLVTLLALAAAGRFPLFDEAMAETQRILSLCPGVCRARQARKAEEGIAAPLPENAPQNLPVN